MPKMRALFIALMIGWAFVACGTHSQNVSRSTAVVTSSPYLFFGWGNPPDPVAVMKETGIKAFTLAFILSGNGCDPAWDGERPLDGDDAAQIKRIRDAGGDVVVSKIGRASL